MIGSKDIFKLRDECISVSYDISFKCGAEVESVLCRLTVKQLEESRPDLEEYLLQFPEKVDVTAAVTKVLVSSLFDRDTA